MSLSPRSIPTQSMPGYRGSVLPPPPSRPANKRRPCESQRLNKPREGGKGKRGGGGNAPLPPCLCHEQLGGGLCGVSPPCHLPLELHGWNRNKKYRPPSPPPVSAPAQALQNLGLFQLKTQVRIFLCASTRLARGVRNGDKAVNFTDFGQG